MPTVQKMAEILLFLHDILQFLGRKIFAFMMALVMTIQVIPLDILAAGQETGDGMSPIVISGTETEPVTTTEVQAQSDTEAVTEGMNQLPSKEVTEKTTEPVTEEITEMILESGGVSGTEEVVVPVSEPVTEPSTGQQGSVGTQEEDGIIVIGGESEPQNSLKIQQTESENLEQETNDVPDQESEDINSETDTEVVIMIIEESADTEPVLLETESEDTSVIESQSENPGVIEETESETEKLLEVEPYGDFEYELLNGFNAYITGYYGADTVVENPNQIDGTIFRKSELQRLQITVQWKRLY